MIHGLSFIQAFFHSFVNEVYSFYMSVNQANMCGEVFTQQIKNPYFLERTTFVGMLVSGGLVSLSALTYAKITAVFGDIYELILVRDIKVKKYELI